MAKIEGLEALKRKFRAMPAAVRGEIAKSVPTSAAELVGMQKRLVPKGKTHALENSIRYEMVTDFKALVIAGGTSETKREVRKGSGEFTDETILVEFGTKAHKARGKFKGARIPAQPARPFFFPAYRALKRRLKGRISRSISTGIKKVAQGS
jgi:hypothetical protein